MRDLTAVYDRVYVDIDDTLIFGFWTDLMRHSWNIFRCNALSELLMTLQFKFRLWKVNRKLLYMLRDQSKVTYLTVRAPSKYTKLMLNFILMGNRNSELVELASDNGPIDKAEFISEDIYTKGYKNVCLVDDSPENRDMAKLYGFDTFNPTGMYDKLCG